jgi:hypothetical protein
VDGGGSLVKSSSGVCASCNDAIQDRLPSVKEANRIAAFGGRGASRCGLDEDMRTRSFLAGTPAATGYSRALIFLAGGTIARVFSE